MSENLAITNRPRRFSEIFGHDEILNQIRNHHKNRPPSAWMFSGPSGCGKTTLADILAVSYNCVHQKMFGESCDACWENKSRFSIHEINAGKEGGIEEIEAVINASSYRPITGLKRVMILNEAHALSSAAQKALLIPTENVPAHLIWIICTTDPAKIIPTLQRRFLQFTLGGLDYDGIEKFVAFTVLKNEKAFNGIDPTFLVSVLQERGIFSPGMILMALDKFAAGAGAEEAVGGGEGGNANTLAICKAVTNGEWKKLPGLLDAVRPDESRWLRSSIAGWLRGILKKTQTSQEVVNATQSLFELMQPAPLEDANLLFWLWAVLTKICWRYKG